MTKVDQAGLIIKDKILKDLASRIEKMLDDVIHKGEYHRINQNLSMLEVVTKDEIREVVDRFNNGNQYMSLDVRFTRDFISILINHV